MLFRKFNDFCGINSTNFVIFVELIPHFFSCFRAVGYKNAGHTFHVCDPHVVGVDMFVDQSSRK